MATKDFYERLSMLGYPLVKKDQQQAANETLLEVAKSSDTRLWEGFPVMLANSVDKQWFDYNYMKNKLKSKKLNDRLSSFIILSLALYALQKVDSPQINKFKEWSDYIKTNDFKYYLEKMKNNEDFMFLNKMISSERVKNTFNNYFYSNVDNKHSWLNEYLSQKDSSDLQYSLSKLFSPGQKKIILKKLQGEKLTKMEQEYFSRVVKKKITALANPELLKLAQKILA